MNVGDVVFREDKPHVITEIVNGAISEVESIEDFVAKQVVIEHGIEMRTLYGLLHECIADYLYHSEVIKERDK